VSPPAAPDLVAAAQSVALAWYAANGRDLAFRRTTDPWAILVSEVMAQQTQAERAAQAWTRFMTQFPTPAALAATSPATVIRSWRGLGYNRRAVALRAAAIAIVEEHSGLVPDDLEALEKLPGIGPYTARAVLAIAFDRPVAALDVNIRRVIGRAFFDPGAATLPPRELQAAADGLVPPGRAAAWTHALMDVGAAFCRPRDPRCDACPLRATCHYAGQAAVDGQPGAAPTAGRSSARAPAVRFEATTRWLRGRIVDRLLDAPDNAWVSFEQRLGDHDVAAVERAIAQLARDGVIELDPGSDGRAARLSAAGAPAPQ
jgi:A/G-specific adenine glycosylase